MAARKKLVRKDARLEVIKRSELFDRISDVHLASGHASRDKVLAELSKKCFNVGYNLVNMYTFLRSI